MKAYQFERIEEFNDKPVIVLSQKRFLRSPKITKFIQQCHIISTYYQWLELPGWFLVDDMLSFQLDTWFNLNRSK